MSIYGALTHQRRGMRGVPPLFVCASLVQLPSLARAEVDNSAPISDAAPRVSAASDQSARVESGTDAASRRASVEVPCATPPSVRESPVVFVAAGLGLPELLNARVATVCGSAPMPAQAWLRRAQRPYS
jgi:hypothetical protein